MMSYVTKEEAVVIAILAGFCAAALLVVLGVSYVIGDLKCSARWRDSGYEHRYGLVSGCQVKRPNGTWAPAASMRELM